MLQKLFPSSPTSLRAVKIPRGHIQLHV
ncbi:hypothetical protein Nmel_016561 [Mimus melanotis]